MMVKKLADDWSQRNQNLFGIFFSRVAVTWILGLDSQKNDNWKNCVLTWLDHKYIAFVGAHFFIS